MDNDDTPCGDEEKLEKQAASRRINQNGPRPYPRTDGLRDMLISGGKTAPAARCIALTDCEKPSRRGTHLFKDVKPTSTDRPAIGENASGRRTRAASGAWEEEVFSMGYPSILTDTQELLYIAGSLPTDTLGKGKSLEIQWKEKIKSKLVGSYSVEKKIFFSFF